MGGTSKNKQKRRSVEPKFVNVLENILPIFFINVFGINGLII
jgi:hypothetical protein